MSKIICIDAGHGGKDVGAICGSRYEKNDNLKFALALGKSLTKQGFIVHQTRTIDTDMSLQARSDLANRVKADYFISCHRNSFPLNSANGVENCVYTKTDQNTINYATAILEEIYKVGVQSKRGIKKFNFHVCRETNMPACLLELGFIKNVKDNDLYDTKFNDYVEAVTKGICKHAGVTYKVEQQQITQPVVQPTGKIYKVQVGAFSDPNNAKKIADELKNKGYPAIVV